ncbi:hypothetical protein ZOSMA_314G00140 [Zostera marina]|uniref:Uncharacterized protein n=1 Tax=Zostera marina TaxID=29655 RepID=A0A0K9PBN6_ZOSMR|nr:hypothetical protein ZOSMA_314G00140 [Zostera marina]
MASNWTSLDTLKGFWNSQIQDEANWAVNVKIVRSLGMFAGSVVVFRSFGDLMAI